MSLFIVQDKGGNEVTRYVAIQATEIEGFPFSDYNHVEAVESEEPATVTRFHGRRILTKLEFRSLFSDETIKWIDRFEAQFEGYAYLTDDQKDSIRTAFANFHEATDVDLDDPRWPPGLGLYVALGGMDAAEVTEVLRG